MKNKIKNENKVIFSHVRYCTSELNQNPDKSYNLEGYVKSGASVSVLVNTVTEEVNSLTEDDTLIFWGSANDVGRNNTTTGLRNIFQFIKNSIHTNIIVVNWKADVYQQLCLSGKLTAAVVSHTILIVTLVLIAHLVVQEGLFLARQHLRSSSGFGQ